MELSQLRYLVAIADEGGFTQAARKMGLSQPSLSLAIKKLEDEIGQPLFDRLTRRVVPTEAGAQMIESARRILDEINRTVNEVRDLKGEVAGTLKIGTIPTIGPFMLPQIIERFSEMYPQVELQVTENVTARLMGMLESGDLDVAITSATPERPGIHTDLISNEELLVVAPANHRLANARSIKWSDLENERFLVLGEEHCLAEQIAWICRKNKVAGRTILEGAQLATIAALVGRGMGVSIVPALMAERQYDNCIFRRLDNPRPSRPLFLAWSILRYRTQAARKFIGVARDAMIEMLENSGAVPESTYPPRHDAVPL